MEQVMTEEEFLRRPLNELDQSHSKFAAHTLALGIDESGKGALIKFIRRDGHSALYFLPTFVAIDFAHAQIEAAKRLRWDTTRLIDFESLSQADWNSDMVDIVFATRSDFFGDDVIVGLSLGGGHGVFHRVRGDLAKALADDLIDERQSGRLIDLRSSVDRNRPQ